MLITLAALLALAAVPMAARPPGPVRTTAAETDSLRGLIERDREKTRTWLRSGATSYLATTLRIDFLERARLTVGRAAGSDVRLDDAAVSPEHLSVTVVGDSFRVEALGDSAAFRIKGELRRSAMVGPSSISVGRHALRLSHQRYPAIIVFDPQSPRYAQYKGIDYFPADLAWRFVVPLTRDPEPDTLVILSTRGLAAARGARRLVRFHGGRNALPARGAPVARTGRRRG